MAFLTMRSLRQLVANAGNGFGLFPPVSCAAAFATGCHRLQPRGSIKAPSVVVVIDNIRGRVGAPLDVAEGDYLESVLPPAVGAVHRVEPMIVSSPTCRYSG